MSVQGFIERLEAERAGLDQAITDYSAQVQAWRGDLVTLDAVLGILRSGQVPETPPNTEPVGELAPVEEVVTDDQSAAEQSPPVDEAPVEQSSADEAPAGTEPSAPAEPESGTAVAPPAEEPGEAAAPEPQADPPAEVSESTDTPTTEDDSAR